MLTRMSFDFTQIMRLWSTPLPAGDAAVEAFARHYTDPVTVNGTRMSLAALADRARATQRAFAELDATLLTQVDTPTHTSIVFRMRGRHVGPLQTPLGEVAPTGKVAERQIIDVLGIQGGLIHEVWVVSDDLGALAQLGVLALA
jgi:hypothetical protein